MNLQGIFPALVTPFASDESVSLSALKQNICLYNETAVAGFVVLGSTGESVMLSREEADSILVVAKEAAAPNKILLAGTGAESTAETIARTKRAAVLGYSFALVKTPYYYKPVYRPENFIRH
jgi:4-hydroxy-2-oxoglutarate aldolase